MTIPLSDGELPREVLSALADIPVFPLPQAVLFPGALLPLHIFEPRYRDMLAHCLESHRALVVARLSEEHAVDAEGRPRFASVGGLGIIVQHQTMSDGRSNIVIQGRARVALEERAADTTYRRVRATVLVDEATPVTSADRAALLSIATTFAGELQKHGSFTFAFPPDAAVETVADLCAQHLLFDADARQAVLEELDVAARIRRVTTELALQQQALWRQAGSPLN
jgi:Lon protease-like protein